MGKNLGGCPVAANVVQGYTAFGIDSSSSGRRPNLIGTPTCAGVDLELVPVGFVASGEIKAVYCGYIRQ